MKKQPPRFKPLMHEAAEYLVTGQLLRRNILAYKAPQNHEGYDLICIHPNPNKKSKIIRVQVKSRYQTDCDRSVFLKERSFKSFDYLILVFLNIGNYYDDSRHPAKCRQGAEYFVLPTQVAKKLYYKAKSGMNRIRTMGSDLDSYKDEKGFELIAKALSIPYPKP